MGAAARARRGEGARGTRTSEAARVSEEVAVVYVFCTVANELLEL